MLIVQHYGRNLFYVKSRLLLLFATRCQAAGFRQKSLVSMLQGRSSLFWGRVFMILILISILSLAATGGKTLHRLKPGLQTFGVPASAGPGGD
jgi:hypothetical protein